MLPSFGLYLKVTNRLSTEIMGSSWNIQFIDISLSDLSTMRVKLQFQGIGEVTFPSFVKRKVFGKSPQKHVNCPFNTKKRHTMNVFMDCLVIMIIGVQQN